VSASQPTNTQDDSERDGRDAAHQTSRTYRVMECIPARERDEKRGDEERPNQRIEKPASRLRLISWHRHTSLNRDHREHRPNRDDQPRQRRSIRVEDQYERGDTLLLGYWPAFFRWLIDLR